MHGQYRPVLSSLTFCQHVGLAVFSVLILMLAPQPLSAQQSAQAPPTQTELNEKLAKYLTHSRWTGKFTVIGKNADPQEEFYEIIEANKAEEGDDWNLITRIKYGGQDVTLPLPPIEIKWAGETPVITVDRVTIPGMGTFDARVIIRQGKYAGVWSHDDVGGHLFGKIEKFDPEAKPQN